MKSTDDSRLGRRPAVALVAIGAAMLATLACASAGSAKTARNDAQRYLRLSQLQFEQGNTLKAIESARKAIDLDSKLGQAHNFLGLIYLSTSQPKLAVDEFKDAVRIDPYFTDARINLGVGYKEIGSFTKARKEFDAALRDRAFRHPEKIHVNLGHLDKAEGEPTEAARSFKRALEISPDYPPAILGLGLAYADLGRGDLATDAYRRVVRLAPDSNEANRARQLLRGRVNQEEL